MKKNKLNLNYNSYTKVGCGSLILIYLAFYLPMVAWTNWNLDFWATHFKEIPTDVPLWVSFVYSIFLPLAFASNLIGTIAHYFV